MTVVSEFSDEGFSGKNIRTQSMAGREQKAKERKWNGGFAPYGYQLKDGNLLIEAYWNIGKSIIEEQGGNEKAEYGTGLLKKLSKQMARDFGKGFTVSNLKNIRQFYLTFPNSYALRSELS